MRVYGGPDRVIRGTPRWQEHYTVDPGADPRALLAEEVTEICLDRELGLLLRASYEGDHELEALEVGDPDPSAFEPAAERVDAGDWLDSGS